MLDPANPLDIPIDSGEALIVETRDEKQLKAPAIGPINVHGAEPGDALRVDFLSVAPRASGVRRTWCRRGAVASGRSSTTPTPRS